MLGGWVHWAPAFENDDAVDWVADWSLAADLSPARDVLLEVVLADEYRSTPGARTIAAAEVVAVVVGIGSVDRLPDQLRLWVSTDRDAASSFDVDAAVLALDRVTAKQSELRELWAKADDDSWLGSVIEIRTRLKRSGR